MCSGSPLPLLHTRLWRGDDDGEGTYAGPWMKGGRRRESAHHQRTHPERPLAPHRRREVTGVGSYGRWGQGRGRKETETSARDDLATERWKRTGAPAELRGEVGEDHKYSTRF